MSHLQWSWRRQLFRLLRSLLLRAMHRKSSGPACCARRARIWFQLTCEHLLFVSPRIWSISPSSSATVASNDFATTTYCSTHLSEVRNRIQLFALDCCVHTFCRPCITTFLSIHFCPETMKMSLLFRQICAHYATICCLLPCRGLESGCKKLFMLEIQRFFKIKHI